MNKLKKIPAFKTEDEEREFWAENDSTEFTDWKKSEKVILPKLKPTIQPAPPPNRPPFL
jgi:hypothetical protein